MLKTGLLFALGLPLIQFLLVLAIALKLEPVHFHQLLAKPKALAWGPGVLVGTRSTGGRGFGTPGRLSRRAGGKCAYVVGPR